MIQKMKVSPITVKRDLADLQAKGIITREGGRKNGRWVILKSIQWFTLPLICRKVAEKISERLPKEDK